MPAKLTDHEREICGRLREFRMAMRYTQSAFAKVDGIPRERLAMYERGNAAVPANVARLLGMSFGLNPDWLLTGKGPQTLPLPRCLVSLSLPTTGRFSVAWPKVLEEIGNRPLVAGIQTAVSLAEENLSTAAELLARAESLPPREREELEQTLAWQVFAERARALDSARRARRGKKLCQSMLDEPKVLADNASVPSNDKTEWDRLRGRLKSATRERGMKSRLAEYCHVTRQAVASWLSGQGMPSANTTLRLLKWVASAEDQQK